MRPWIPLLAIGLLAVSAAAQLPDDLEVGAYVEVEGTPAPDGLVAEEVEVRALPGADARVRGAVDALDARTGSLSIGGVAAVLEPDVRPTDDAGRPRELASLEPGLPVDARGVYRDGVLRVRSCSVGSGAAERKVKLVGAIDAVDPDADGFRLLGVGVRVTPDTWIELD